MKKVLKSVLLLALLLCYNSCVDCKDSNEPQAPTVEPEKEVEVKVTVTTGVATNVSSTSAEVSGNVESLENVDSEVEIGVVYGTDTIPSIYSGRFVSSHRKVEGTYTVTLSDLKPSTTYYYRSCVIVDGKGYYGEVKTFITASTETPTEEKVVVTTGAATNITNATATISGSVEIPNTVKSVINVGFVYSATVTNPSINTGILRLSNQSPDSEFNVVLSGLKCDITYYYRTYVYIDGKGYYGEVKTFTTEKVIVTTGTATNITNSTAIINGSISNFIPDGISPVEIGVRFGKDPSELYSKISIESNTSGEFSVSLTGLESGTTYYYCSCIRIYEIYYKGEVLSFTTKDEITSGQEVDLGLSVKWAGWNVGATSPEQYGGYYAWGEIEEKSDYSESTYTHYNNGYINIGDNISGTQYDVATVKWGNGWRMPTKEECKELYDNCRFEGYTYGGVVGVKVTGPNGNAIFLPAAGSRYGTSLYDAGDYGYYWSGSLSEYYSYDAWYLNVSDYGSHYMNYSYRRYGQSVRPVR